MTRWLERGFLRLPHRVRSWIELSAIALFVGLVLGFGEHGFSDAPLGVGYAIKFGASWAVLLGCGFAVEAILKARSKRKKQKEEEERPKLVEPQALAKWDLNPGMGGGMSQVFSVTLASGRTCRVTGVHFHPSYDWVLFEGGGVLTEKGSEDGKRFAIELARKYFGEPLHIVRPELVQLTKGPKQTRPWLRLPWMACAAKLDSDPMSDGLVSSLTLVWWQDAFRGSIADEIQRAAAAVDWEREARDYDF
jgi:hypothetical protein